ncbi:40S ribosomal protein S27 [Zancudomyces culisetae]|uniref:40S ribosomal protein S27 n=1 Tax=Zancudomyces culisetae TaxID=1213189 RepID=A0A1R1PYQ6_ZANCU|nr:40S ribosomal protein S27 [Zancudomyces culisetae]|eukprot:OMH86059.1 40S ribosomal protein S27 [Zancudomyces culisetae]
MDVKCHGCYNITTVFSHAQTVVVCNGCSTILCQPTGGLARLTEGSIEEETSLKDIRFVIAKLEDVYSELKKSAAALPPLNYTSNNTAQFGRDKGVGARENLSETSERQKAAQISNVTISGIIESRRERTSKTQREETPEIPLSNKERENQYREYEEKYTLLAKILIQLYGDFNGGTAVLQGLSRTELNRLRKGEIAGVHSSQPLIQTINEWKWAGSILDVDTYTTDGYFEHIFTFLEQKKKELTELKFKGRLLASIPYMKHHEDEIRKLYQEYTFMHSHNNGNEEKLVTGPGAELLKAHEDLMKSCYYDNTADGDIQGSQPIKESVSTSVLGLPGGKTEHKNIVKAIGMLLFSENEVPIYQDLTIQHWLLTRPYLDGAELWKLSTRVLPIRLSDEQYFSPKNNVNYDQMQPNMMTFEELSEDEYYSNQDSATDAKLIVNFDALL